MKNIKLNPFVLVTLAILLSACGSAVRSATSTGGGKQPASAIAFAFTGVIESIVGDQWVVNAPNINLDMKVDPSIIKDGPFKVGDSVNVEARVDADGSVVALRVGIPSAADLANDISNDADGNEVFGIVESISATSITIAGQTYLFAPGVEMIVPGAFVEIQLIVNSDGTVSVQRVELSDSSQNGNDNSNDVNGNDDNDNGNSNDDNNNDDNSNDD